MITAVRSLRTRETPDSVLATSDTGQRAAVVRCSAAVMGHDSDALCPSTARRAGGWSWTTVGIKFGCSWDVLEWTREDETILGGMSQRAVHVDECFFQPWGVLASRACGGAAVVCRAGVGGRGLCTEPGWCGRAVGCNARLLDWISDVEKTQEWERMPSGVEGK